MTQKIEVEAKKSLPYPLYDVYSGKLPNGERIIVYLSFWVIADPKPKRIKVTLEWDEGGENNKDVREVREE